MPDYRYNILLKIVASYSCEIIMFDNVTLKELLFSNKAISIIKFASCFGFLFVDILFSRIKNKVLQVFPKEEFDVVLHTFNPCNSKIQYINLRIFQTMLWERLYSLPCLTMLLPRISIFFVCSEVTSFFTFLLIWCTLTFKILIFLTTFCF